MDAGAFVIVEQPPFVASRADRVFDPVVDVVYIARMFKAYPRQIDFHDPSVGIELEPAQEIGFVVIGGVVQPFAPFGGQGTQVGHGIVAGGEQARLGAVCSGIAGDLGDGFRAVIEADCFHCMRFVQVAAAAGEGEPCCPIDAVVAGVQKKEPQGFAGFANAIFEPVVKGIHVGCGVEIEARQVNFDDLRGFVEHKAGVDGGGTEICGIGHGHQN